MMARRMQVSGERVAFRLTDESRDMVERKVKELFEPFILVAGDNADLVKEIRDFKNSFRENSFHYMMLFDHFNDYIYRERPEDPREELIQVQAMMQMAFQVNIEMRLDRERLFHLSESLVRNGTNMPNQLVNLKKNIESYIGCSNFHYKYVKNAYDQLMASQRSFWDYFRWNLSMRETFSLIYAGLSASVFSVACYQVIGYFMSDE